MDEFDYDHMLDDPADIKKYPYLTKTLGEIQDEEDAKDDYYSGYVSQIFQEVIEREIRSDPYLSMNYHKIIKGEY